ncbi:CDP-diacylglycerol--glycerol-3-phosphate 3-phosphatidyltransferase [Olavius algarvensis spirochete endosymbiont]|uniref:CDP-diacylglycerol--glycerol-3-phosphate 3-phosphatidyltransferase n=1 Tax=Olavius algarvensis spirochete endosymbiont TaxID=260710 RepID=UPI000F2166F3|nr:CDP-diacylglycerol--glycerol-3-phosphate 3-phosphatidyltransferase [Olavius algarvensis spirochete endosymbiont]VDA99594.1 CDP-diacylglycerol--glycerol-3-phosphate 3-phosphatidyltransferase [Olavius algarvensis spirochete endosymbiont]
MPSSNNLTIIRICCAPFIFLAWYFLVELGHSPRLGTLILWALFCFGASTDILDGYLARKMGQVTDIGKLMDPFSDMLLTVTFFVCFLNADLMRVWTLIIILWREFTIMFIRMLMAYKQIAIGASFAGKLKTALYFVGVAGGLIALTLRVWLPTHRFLPIVEFLSGLLFIIAALIALISLINYIRTHLVNLNL